MFWVFVALPLKVPAVVVSAREMNSGNMPNVIKQDGYREHHLAGASLENHITVTTEERNLF